MKKGAEKSKSKDEANIDIKVAQWAEAVILSIFILIGRVARTWFYFIVFPNKFSSSVTSANPLDQNFPGRYARPLTYFFFSTIGMTIILIRIIGETEGNQGTGKYQEFIQTVMSGDFVGMIVGISPLVLLVGLNALSLKIASLIVESDLTFKECTYDVSYLIGSFFSSVSLLSPIIDIFINRSILMLLFVLLITILPFRVYYSFVVLIKYSLDSSLRKAFGVFVLNFISFIPMYLITLLWVWPMIG